MEGIKTWFKLNPEILTILILLVILIIVLKVVKKIVVTGVFLALILVIFIFRGNIFPQATQAKEMVDKITTRGKEYVITEEYKNDLSRLKEKYPEIVELVEKKTKEILGE